MLSCDMHSNVRYANNEVPIRTILIHYISDSLYSILLIFDRFFKTKENENFFSVRMN